jgi:tetratricopeptide (TPR) repeat protein
VNKPIPIFQSILGIGVKVLLVIGLMTLGVAVVQITFKAVDTDQEFHFLSKNNQGVAGFLIEASETYIKENPEIALRVLTKATEVNVVDSRIYLLTGLAHERLGQFEDARYWMEASHRLGPRKPMNQMEIGQFWFRQHDIDKALFHWMIALEMNPQYQGEGFKDLLRFMRKPLYLEAFKRLLKTHHPLWWESFFSYAASHAEDLASLKALYEARLSSGFEVSPLEEDALFERLMRDRQWADAYFTWLNQLSTQELNQLGNIFDGNFLLPPSNKGFGWRIHEEAAYSVFFKNHLKDKTSGEAILYFTGASAKHLTPLTQLLLLEPGLFKLKGEVMMDHLQAGEGLFWELSCHDGRVINQSLLFIGSKAWHSFETAFEIPRSRDCEVQRLNLKIRQDINQPFRYDGSIAFRALNIARVVTQ